MYLIPQAEEIGHCGLSYECSPPFCAGRHATGRPSGEECRLTYQALLRAKLFFFKRETNMRDVPIKKCFHA